MLLDALRSAAATKGTRRPSSPWIADWAISFSRAATLLRLPKALWKSFSDDKAASVIILLVKELLRLARV